MHIAYSFSHVPFSVWNFYANIQRKIIEITLRAHKKFMTLHWQSDSQWDILTHLFMRRTLVTNSCVFFLLSLLFGCFIIFTSSYKKKLRFYFFNATQNWINFNFFPSFYIKVFFVHKSGHLNANERQKKNQRRWIKAIFHFCSSFPLLIGIQTFILIPMHSSACKLFQWN